MEVKHLNSEVTLSDKRDLTHLYGQTELLLMEDSHVRGKRIILRLKYIASELALIISPSGRAFLRPRESLMP